MRALLGLVLALIPVELSCRSEGKVEPTEPREEIHEQREPFESQDKADLLRELGEPFEITKLPLAHELLQWHVPRVWWELAPPRRFVFDSEGHSVRMPSEEALAQLLDARCSNDAKLAIMESLAWIPAE